MIYIKVTDSTGTVVAAEQHQRPIFVRWQRKNKIPVHCNEPVAQGIVSGDRSVVYQLAGREALPGDRLTASIISEPEYEQLQRQLAQATPPDPEDTAPVVPEDAPEEIYTRAELTAKIRAIEPIIEAVKRLLGDRT